MIYIGLYLITCLSFTPIINKSFDNISDYGFCRLILVTIAWPVLLLFILCYVIWNHLLDFFEDYNDRS
jgi:hypothetical protein